MRNVFTNGYCTSSSDPSAHMRMLENVRKALIEIMQHQNASAIAVRGTSGMSVAYGLRTLDTYLHRDVLPFILVRKDDGHHGGPVETLNFRPMSIGRYIILDDFISSGNTVVAMMEKLECMMDPDVTCCGIVLYDKMHNLDWQLRERGAMEFKRNDGNHKSYMVYQ